MYCMVPPLFSQSPRLAHLHRLLVYLVPLLVTGSSTHLISSFLPCARASSTYSSCWLVHSPGPGSLFCLLVCLVPPLITTLPTHLDQFVSIVCLLFGASTGNWLARSPRSACLHSLLMRLAPHLVTSLLIYISSSPPAGASGDPFCH